MCKLRRFIKIKRGIFLGLTLLFPTGIALAGPVPTGKPTAYPAWWFERDVVLRTDINKANPAWPGDYPAADDYAVLLQGQLKHVAVKAYAEMLACLPAAIWSTAQGQTLTAAVAWTPGQGDDYAVMNQGQVKALFQTFYDVLIVAGYTTQLPWTEGTTDDDNYAVANLGQAKQLFSFDLTVSAGQLPAWWQQYYLQSGGVDPGGDVDGDGLTNLQEFQQGSNPSDYFSQGANTITPKIFVFSGGGVAVPLGEYSADPIIYKVVNATTGENLVHAPVTVEVSEGTGLLSLTQGGATQTSFVIGSDSEGLVKVYFKAP